MRVAVPVKANKHQIDNFFGRAPYFAILDSDTRQITYEENVAAQVEGGAGTRAAQVIVDLGIDCLGLPQCGKNAQDVLEAADIEVYQTEGNSVRENLESLMAGTLLEFDEAHPGFNWGN